MKINSCQTGDTYSENRDRPACIKLILTNCPPSFQNTNTVETELSDLHELTFTVLKQHYPKKTPQVIIHWQYKNFSNDYFRKGVESVMLKYDFNYIDYKI